MNSIVNYFFRSYIFNIFDIFCQRAADCLDIVVSNYSQLLFYTSHLFYLVWFQHSDLEGHVFELEPLLDMQEYTIFIYNFYTSF